jgi:hypothetical protein
MACCFSQAALHAVLLACTLAAGCANASIGLQKDGTYTLDSSEQTLDCGRLSNNIWGRLQVLKSLPDKAKVEREAAAPTAVQAVGSWFGGSTKGLASLEEYDRERAHVRSLHRTFIGKGCPPLDIESELAATDAAIAEYR